MSKIKHKRKTLRQYKYYKQKRPEGGLKVMENR